jgi:serine/threonine protein kinase
VLTSTFFGHAQNRWPRPNTTVSRRALLRPAGSHLQKHGYTYCRRPHPRAGSPKKYQLISHGVVCVCVAVCHSCVVLSGPSQRGTAPTLTIAFCVWDFKTVPVICCVLCVVWWCVLLCCEHSVCCAAWCVLRDVLLRNVQSERARNYIKSLPPFPKEDYTKRFPLANPLAVNLMSQLLTFNPRRRPNVAVSLTHPCVCDDRPFFRNQSFGCLAKALLRYGGVCREFAVPLRVAPHSRRGLTSDVLQ